MPELIHIVTPEEAGKTVGIVVQRRFRLSGGAYRSLKWRPGAIRLNGQPVFVSAAVNAGDVLTVELAERRPPSPHISPAAFRPELLYEDEFLLVLNKPAGIPMHDKSSASTIAGALRAYLGPETAAHFVNRLDKGVSGVVLAAKSGYIHDRFRTALHTGALYREYRAVAEGIVTPTVGVITLPIGPAEGGDFRRQAVRTDGRYAETAYEALLQTEARTLLRLVPKTGRTHQLRLHMSAIGHPLVGDGLYGTVSEEISRPALHAYLLRFTHPITGQVHVFEAPIPPDMEGLLIPPL